MKLSNPKLKALTLYFANNTNPKYLGEVKLMKLFYFLDFRHVKRYGAPVTYDTYVNLDHGPIPSFIKNVVDDTACGVETPLSEVIKFETPAGTKMKRVIAKRQFTDDDKGHLSPSELEILKEVSKEFAEKRTNELEVASHKEAPWRETEYLEEIPYTLATLDKDCKVDREQIELFLKLW
jgi:uncharacterized phage-associated protein